MIKAIIFDAAGVFLKGSFVSFVNKVYEVLGIDKVFSAHEEVVFDPELNKGTITCDDCFRKAFGGKIDAEQMDRIKALWTTTWVIDDDMRRLAEDLKPRYKLAMLSNSDKLNSENYTKKGWYSYFDVLVLSHEVGILKPDPRIYRILLERLGCLPEECVFIDDQKRVLEPAKALGMHTIHYRSILQLKAELEKLGV